MLDEREPDAARLAMTRQSVRTYLRQKRRATTLLFWATLAAEAVFLGLMLLFMDFHNQLYWFLLFGLMLVYAPLILFSWHNSVKLDHVYYRLLDDLKYDKSTPSHPR